jgi:hypothetical protein
MSGVIADEAAIQYSTWFYYALASGRSVANAHQYGLAALELRSTRGLTRDVDRAAIALQTPIPRLLTQPGTNPNHIYLTSITASVPQPPILSNRARIHIEIELDLEWEKLEPNILALIMSDLSRLTGGRLVRAISVQKGSVRFTVSLDPAAAGSLHELRAHGMLTRLAGIVVLDVIEQGAVEPAVSNLEAAREALRTAGIDLTTWDARWSSWSRNHVTREAAEDQVYLAAAADPRIALTIAPTTPRGDDSCELIVSERENDGVWSTRIECAVRPGVSLRIVRWRLWFQPDDEARVLAERFGLAGVQLDALRETHGPAAWSELLDELLPCRAGAWDLAVDSMLSRTVPGRLPGWPVSYQLAVAFEDSEPTAPPSRGGLNGHICRDQSRTDADHGQLPRWRYVQQQPRRAPRCGTAGCNDPPRYALWLSRAHRLRSCRVPQRGLPARAVPSPVGGNRSGSRELEISR